MVQVRQGIRAERITTPRLTSRVLFFGEENAEPVLFLHGNASSATTWEENMLALPSKYRAVAPDQRGFGNADPNAVIDATRGLRDLEDDAVALLDHLKIDKVHLVGHSAGGRVALGLLADHPTRILSVTLVATVSPYGMGTKNMEGDLCFPDGAGSGAGTIPDHFVTALEDKSKGEDVRNLMNSLFFHPPFRVADEDTMLEVIFQMQVGEKGYPGDKAPSPNWPFFAPGKYGLINAMSGIYARKLTSLFAPSSPKPPVLWVRGLYDTAVQEAAQLDVAVFAQQGLIPGWPGNDVFPPQPSLTQIRHVLTKYEESGGTWKEVALESGHFPFLEKASEFDALLHAHLARSR